LGGFVPSAAATGEQNSEHEQEKPPAHPGDAARGRVNAALTPAHSP
jgi:hypothetical protein